MNRPVLVWIVLSLIWGSSWLVIKVGLNEGLPPFTFAGWRFLVGLAPLTAILAWRRVGPPSRADARLMLSTGLLTFSVTYGLVFWAEQHIASGLTALLFATFPIFGMLIAHTALDDERLTAPGLVGVLLGIAGVGLLVWDQQAAAGPWAVAGCAAVLTAAASSAWADVAIKKRGTHIDPVVMTTAQLGVGTITLLGVGALFEGNPFAHRFSPAAVASIAYLGVVPSALAFVLLYWLMRRMPVTRTMLLTLVTPLVAAVLGVLLLGESLTTRDVLGGALILLGLWVTLRR